MKKYLIFLIVLFLLVGCSKLNELNYDEVIDKVLKEDNVKTNANLHGYKLYIPTGMTMLGDLKGNEILYSGKDKYYLYVDIVSFYNKKQNRYNVEKLGFEYSKDIDYNNLSGYVTVSKLNDAYLLEIMYNYAKIEVVTKNVNKAIANSLIVLKSIEYNYKIIDSMIGSNTLVYDSELFTLLGPSTKSDNFLSYIEEYGVYDEEESDNDEDVIEISSAD